MQTRSIGPLTASALGLGCMGMSQSYGPGDEDESQATLDRALEIGCTFWDTADVYGAGANEQLLGRWFARTGERDAVTLASKCGLVPVAGQPAPKVDGSPAHVTACIDASLARLGVDHLDLWYLHRVDPDVPIEDTVGAMAGAVAAGKVRALGLSEVSAATLRRAVAVHPVAAVQSEWSLWTRDPEAEVIPACRELGVAFVPFSPLGRGMLTGKLESTEAFGDNDFRKRNPRFAADAFDANLALVKAVEAVAAEKGATAGQLALAWLLAQGDDIVPIPGTKRRRWLEENVAAADLALTADDVARIDAAIPADQVVGARYPAGMRMNETK